MKRMLLLLMSIAAVAASLISPPASTADNYRAVTTSRVTLRSTSRPCDGYSSQAISEFRAYAPVERITIVPQPARVTYRIEKIETPVAPLRIVEQVREAPAAQIKVVERVRDLPTEGDTTVEVVPAQCPQQQRVLLLEQAPVYRYTANSYHNTQQFRSAQVAHHSRNTVREQIRDVQFSNVQRVQLFGGRSVSKTRTVERNR